MRARTILHVFSLVSSQFPCQYANKIPMFPQYRARRMATGIINVARAIRSKKVGSVDMIGVLKYPLALMLFLSAFALAADIVSVNVGPIEYKGTLTFDYIDGGIPINYVSYQFDTEINEKLLILRVPQGWSYVQSPQEIVFSGGQLPINKFIVDVSLKNYVEPGKRPFTATATTGKQPISTKGTLSIPETPLLKICYLVAIYRIPLLGSTVTLLAISSYLIIFSPKSPLINAQKKLEETIFELESKNLTKSVHKIDSAIKSIEEAKSSEKFQIGLSIELRTLEELNFISKDLEILKQDILKVEDSKIIELLPLITYVSGIKCVLGQFPKIKDYKKTTSEELSDEGEPSKIYCVAYISKQLGAGSLEEVVYNIRSSSSDLWFYWPPEDYEPIKIILKNDRIESALYRWHWQHIRVSNPYLDEKSRIHAFFIPYFNTPMIRRSKEDVFFSIFIDCFNAIPQTYEVAYQKPIPEYSISKGTKYKHPPKVEYSGWPE
jgi:hypothetical protein